MGCVYHVGSEGQQRQGVDPRMASVWRTWVVGAQAARRARTVAWWTLNDLGRVYAEAFEREWEQRRFFLWLPAVAGTGVLLYFAADREPVLWLPMLLVLGFGFLAVRWQGSRPALMAAVIGATLAAGFLAAELRALQRSAPVLTRLRIAHLSGVVEEVDHRRAGSRFVLRVTGADVFTPAERPERVRLTARGEQPIAAGDRVDVTARLLPPSGPAMPGGYAFARDAYFAGFGAVGSVLGAVRPSESRAEAAAGSGARMWAAVDRARNALAHRVDGLLGGDIGAIGAAMVTGKRDLLSDDGREIIREAGIFHIITIAGVQMTLVAGLLYGLTRRALACSAHLALHRPIKKWAALVAMTGAVAYDVLTGGRIGTQRALLMTLIMLGAVLVDRRGFTMRNLALAALAVILLEPEALMGASFQLSFAAVAALVAVYEARARAREKDGAEDDRRLGGGADAGLWGWPARLFEHLRGLLVATLCATGATASFMAANFHELSPYVLVGNPVTLGVIEFFAVPGALLGCLLYSLGLDGPVWRWVGLGIRLVLWVARLIGSAPAATLTMPAFAPWALPLLALAVLSAVIWRSLPFRLTAVPLACLGLWGATLGPRYDLLVAGSGDLIAVRGETGRLAAVGRVNGFALEQWLRADGDGRPVAGLKGRIAESGRCDPLACIVPLPGNQTLSLVADPRAFAEDCRRVDVIVTALRAPASCAAPLIVDRMSLAATGSLGLTLRNGGWVPTPARGAMEDRPWSPAPPAPRPATEAVPATEPDPPPDESP